MPTRWHRLNRRYRRQGLETWLASFVAISGLLSTLPWTREWIQPASISASFGASFYIWNFLWFVGGVLTLMGLGFDNARNEALGLVLVVAAMLIYQIAIIDVSSTNGIIAVFSFSVLILALLGRIYDILQDSKKAVEHERLTGKKPS